MATWQTPAAFTAGTSPSEADFDTLTNDLSLLGDLTSMGRALKNFTSPDEIGLEVIGSDTDSSDRTTTSTSFTDLTGVSVTCAVNSGFVILIARGQYGHSTGGDIYLDINIDGADQGGTDGLYRSTVRTAGAFVFVKTGLSVANHTFKLRWKVTAGTATAYGLSSYPTSLFVLGG